MATTTEDEPHEPTDDEAPDDGGFLPGEDTTIAMGFLVRLESPVDQATSDALMDAIMLLRDVDSVEDFDTNAANALPKVNGLLEKLRKLSAILWKNASAIEDADWFIRECPESVPAAYREALEQVDRARSFLDDLLEKVTSTPSEEES